MSEFRFDPISFLIGFISSAILAAAVYRFRHAIGGLRRQASAGAESARRFATRTADARYQIDLGRYCQRYHIAGRLVKLTDVLIEPRFIPGVEPYDTSGEHRMRNPFHVIPLIHRFPAAYAPFNIRTIGIPDLGAGDRHLALLGQPGSGRSVALAAIALWALGDLQLEPPADPLKASLEEEEARLDKKVRDARQAERSQIQARALETIARAQEEARATLTASESLPEAVDLRRLMPILVHLGDIVIDPASQARLDPAEPLVQAMQRNLRRVTALTTPRYIYNRLSVGQALVLLDGLDDLPPAEQQAKLAWLGRFLKAYPDCVVIVVGPATGFHPLQELGLTPVFLRPWMDADIQRYAEKWAAVWPRITRARRRATPPPDERAIRMVTTNARALTPLDLTGRILATYHQNNEAAENLTRWDWYNHLVTRDFRLKDFEKNPDLADTALYAVALLAARILTNGPLPAEQLRQAADEALRAAGKAEGKAPARLPLDPERFLQLLVEDSRLLIQRAGGQFDFAHPVLRAFLASVTLLAADSQPALEDVVTDPAWQIALPFAAAKAPTETMNRAVVRKLSQQPDLLFQNLFDLACWMADAPADAPWRGEVFRRFGAALVSAAQFPVLREWAMAALVSTRDRGATLILRQALRSTDPQVRCLGCVGLGAFGDSEAIRELRSMTEDEELDVQLAAYLALAAIGTDRAIELLTEGIRDGHESLRQAIAESLAAYPEPGYALLHEAVRAEDMLMRRAAVFGLARINTPWALTDLYERMLEDDQWYVRSAAEQALARSAIVGPTAATAHPAVEKLEWVNDWVAEQSQQTAPGEDARHMLINMLRTGSQGYRVASARTLGKLGYLPALPALYQILADDAEPIRVAGYAALADLETQLASPLPGVL